MRFRSALTAILMWWITFTACGSDEPMRPMVPPMPRPPLVFASVTAGTDETCGVTTNDDGYCWGGLTASSDSDEETLGPPTMTGSDAPTQVAGGISFQSVVAGGDQTCGIATSGTVYCWGLAGAD